MVTRTDIAALDLQPNILSFDIFARDDVCDASVQTCGVWEPLITADCVESQNGMYAQQEHSSPNDLLAKLNETHEESYENMRGEPLETSTTNPQLQSANTQCAGDWRVLPQSHWEAIHAKFVTHDRYRSPPELAQDSADSDDDDLASLPPRDQLLIHTILSQTRILFDNAVVRNG